MANELTEIELEEVALVDRGANQAADIVLTKREGPIARLRGWFAKMTGPASVSEVLEEERALEEVHRLVSALYRSLESIQFAEGLEPAERLALLKQTAAEFVEASATLEGGELAKSIREEVAALSALDQIPAAMATLKKALTGEEEQTVPNETKPEAPEAKPTDTAEISKAERDTLIAKAARADELEAELRKRDEEAKRVALTKRVGEKIATLPGTPAAKVVELLEKADKVEGLAAELEEVLAKAAAAVDGGALLEEAGSVAAPDGDALAQLTAIADELRKEAPGLTREQAFAKALDKRADLAAAHYANG